MDPSIFILDTPGCFAEPAFGQNGFQRPPKTWQNKVVGSNHTTDLETVAGLALSMFWGSKMSLQLAIMASRSPLARVRVLLSSCWGKNHVQRWPTPKQLCRGQVSCSCTCCDQSCSSYPVYQKTKYLGLWNSIVFQLALHFSPQANLLYRHLAHRSNNTIAKLHTGQIARASPIARWQNSPLFK